MCRMIRTLLLTALFGMGCHALRAQDHQPTVTIHTSWEENQEGTLFISITSNDETSVRIDAGYGEVTLADTDEDGNFRAKGNVVKVYGHFEGIVAPMDVTRDVVFAENDFITDVAIIMSPIDRQADLTPCHALQYASFMGCELDRFDFSLVPATITSLHLFGNGFQEVVLPDMPDLDIFSAGWNENLTKVDVSHAPNLTNLDVSSSPLLAELDLSRNKKLTHLSAYDCAFETIDLSACDKLENVSLSDNKLTMIKFGNTEAFTVLNVHNNKLSSIDLSNMSNLLVLTAGGNPDITSLDLSKCRDLMTLSVAGTSISTIDAKQLASLENLDVGQTKLTSLDVSGMTNLSMLSIERCYEVTSLNVNGCTNINSILIDGNKLDFAMTKKMADDLPTTEDGLIGAFSMDDPKEFNQMYDVDVQTCINKGFEVLQKALEGDAIPYPGVPTSVQEIQTDGKPVAIIDHGHDIEIRLAGDSAKSRITIFDVGGRKVFSTVAQGLSTMIAKDRLGKGVFVLTAGTRQMTFRL